MSKIFVLGINHKYAPVEFREKLAFSKSDVPSALENLKSLEGFSESLLLSTCNRVEIYGVAEDTSFSRETLLDFLSHSHGVDRKDLQKATYFYEQEPAIRHLFRVTSGLDSMVVGENEILGQIKESFKLASQAGNAKSLLHQLFERAFRTAKRTKEETEISEGAVSVSSVAVELAEKIFGRLSQENILLVGTGEVSELTLKRLLKVGSRAIWVTSRNYERAEELARRYGIQAVYFEDWKNYLREADIVISSTAAPHPILRYEEVRQVMDLRKHKPLFMIDLAVPRDVEEKVNTIDDVYLYNIDDLQNVCTSNLKYRRKEIAKCELVVEKQVSDFMQWLRHLELVPTIQKLQAHLDRIIQEELQASGLVKGSEAHESLRLSLERIKGKILHEPITRLKQAQTNGGGYHYYEVLHTLFDLEKVTFDGTQKENSDREPGQRTGTRSGS